MTINNLPTTDTGCIDEVVEDEDLASVSTAPIENCTRRSHNRKEKLFAVLSKMDKLEPVHQSTAEKHRYLRRNRRPRTEYTFGSTVESSTAGPGSLASSPPLILTVAEERASTNYIFAATVLSNVFFVLGCILFVASSVHDLLWYQQTADIPTSILGSTDQETWELYLDNVESNANGNDEHGHNNAPSDLARQIAKRGIAMIEDYVSTYQVLTVLAAVCFALVGLLDGWRQRQRSYYGTQAPHGLFMSQSVMQGRCIYLGSACMLIGGALGICSSLTLEQSELSSNVLNVASVLCYLVTALTIVSTRKHFQDGISLKFFLYVFWTGDACFVMGATTNLLLSLVHLLDRPHHQFRHNQIHDASESAGRSMSHSIPLCRLQVYASTLWLVCSLIYLYATLFIYRNPATTKYHTRHDIALALQAAEMSLKLQELDGPHASHKNQEDETIVFDDAAVACQTSSLV